MKGVWEIGVCARPGVLVSVHHGPELSSKAAAKQKQGYRMCVVQPVVHRRARMLATGRGMRALHGARRTCCISLAPLTSTRAGGRGVVSPGRGR